MKKEQELRLELKKARSTACSGPSQPLPQPDPAWEGRESDATEECSDETGQLSVVDPSPQESADSEQEEEVSALDSSVPSTSWRGISGGPLFGMMPDKLNNSIEDALVHTFGAENVKRLLEIAWEGWEELATAILGNQMCEEQEQFERGFVAVSKVLPRFLRIA